MEKMSASDGTETSGGITVKRDNQTKIVNCIGRLTLADQFQCMGNQSVTYGLSGWQDVRKDHISLKVTNLEAQKKEKAMQEKLPVTELLAESVFVGRKGRAC